jgi:hypothetical protein
MNPRPSLLLVVSAVVYLAAAVVLLFAPQELLRFAGAEPATLVAALLQVLGSALLGFAMLNWNNRFSRIGGIFGRPLVVANLAHSVSAALLLAPIVSRASFPPLPAVALGLYTCLAIAFGIKFLGPSATAAE